MTPPKPPRKSLMMKSLINSTYDITAPAYQDPDSNKPPSVPDQNPPEARVKPIPRPRSKVFPKAQNQTGDTTDIIINNNNNNSQVLNGESAERPRPVRPPPRPPPAKGVTVGRVLPTVDRQNHYIRSNSEPLLQLPAMSTDAKKKGRPPDRPPPPSVYYDRLATLTQPQTPPEDSPLPQENPSDSVNLPEDGGKQTEGTERPAVPPRLSQRLRPPPYSEADTLPMQSRPPPPSFTPPPPPPPTEPPPTTNTTTSQSIYSEIEHRPYLDVLPEDEETVLMHRRSTPRSGLRFQSGCFSFRQQTLGDPDDIIGMLRWLTRVSKSDYMTPSLYGLSIEEEIRSLNQRARDVNKALRLFNLLMLKRSEPLRNIIADFHAISSSLDKMKKKNKTMGIAGGTTGAVGGVTAVLGIALAPVTMGASLIATALGAGMVASAGGMGAHAAKANKKTVNKMKVEKLVYEYKTEVADAERCLDLVLRGMNELRRHDVGRIQRAGAEPDAVKMAHLSAAVLANAEGRGGGGAGGAGARPWSSDRLLQAFAKELDQYFTEEDGQKMKKSNKSRFSGRVRLLAENLQDQLDYLNHMWEMFS